MTSLNPTRAQTCVISCVLSTQHQHHLPSSEFVAFQGAFNAGARFDARTRPTIPPPPPGCAPNMAQLAAMSGATVVASKKKNDKWGAGAGGGAVFW